MPVRVIHGANEGCFPFEGRTVEHVARTLREVFNVPADAMASVNGIEVSGTYILEDGDCVEFVRPLGQKGGLHDFWSREELVAFFGDDEVRQMEDAGMTLTPRAVLTTDEVMSWDSWLRDRQNPPDTFPTHMNIEGDGLPIRINGVEIDRTRFTVSDDAGHPCFLGNTIPFGLIRRLAQRPDVFIHIDVLKQDVWKDEHVQDETVMRTARSLRAKLREAGIVAVTVNTSQKQHVALTKQ